eukprot:TRINITY_DN15229_c0_g1_i1.p1 TRINITY_DN15229_c0_g1~~TRINITY_DN15229_c0_g1_i1.p1  ORF type:complete len:207 (+),score=51.43 TRINITY_DN15229_c0_g1_i1:1-621(+)
MPSSSAFSCVSSPRDRITHSEERELGQSFPSRRRQSLPARPAEVQKPAFRHWGSSLSMNNNDVGELTSRTLRPPSPPSTPTPRHPQTTPRRARKPSLPDLRVELNHPKLEDYLEKPRFVNSISSAKAQTLNNRGNYATLYKNPSSYRNLRLGNFLEEEEGENYDNNPEELIPERLRLYYLDTYLKVCDTCDSLSHCNPNSPIHKGL